MAHHRAWKPEQWTENSLMVLGWCFLPSIAPFLPALTKRLGSEVGGRVRSHLAPASLLQSCCSSPPFAARAAAYDSGLGTVKARASILALWLPGHIHPLTFSESRVMSSQEKQQSCCSWGLCLPCSYRGHLAGSGPVQEGCLYCC